MTRAVIRVAFPKLRFIVSTLSVLVFRFMPEGWALLRVKRVNELLQSKPETVISELKIHLTIMPAWDTRTHLTKSTLVLFSHSCHGLHCSYLCSKRAKELLSPLRSAISNGRQLFDA